MKKFLTLLLAGVFVCSLVLIGSADKAEAGKTIKIGTILNLTGPIAFIGPLFKNGIVKALEEINYTVNRQKDRVDPRGCGG